MELQQTSDIFLKWWQLIISSSFGWGRTGKDIRPTVDFLDILFVWQLSSARTCWIYFLASLISIGEFLKGEQRKECCLSELHNLDVGFASRKKELSLEVHGLREGFPLGIVGTVCWCWFETTKLAVRSIMSVITQDDRHTQMGSEQLLLQN